MRSATERLPRSSTLLTIWVTSTEWYTGSGISSRRGAGPLRGIAGAPSAFALRAVPAASLLAIAHAGGVERAADDLVADTGEVLHPATAHEHDRVLLKVVTLTRDVGGDLHAAGEPDAGDLAKRRVRLLRRVRVDARAHPPTLGRALQRGRLRLRRLGLPALADQLLDGGHGGSRILARHLHGQPAATPPAGVGREGGSAVGGEQLVAQVAFADLAGGVAGQLAVPEPDANRDLERRQPVPAVPLQLLDGHGRALLELHHRADLLAEDVVGDAEDGRVGYRRVLEQRGFDLGRIDVLATPDDHVLGPVGDRDEPVLVEAGDVAGAQPAAGQERLRRGLGLVPVPLHDVRAAHPQLAGLADRQVVALLVDDADVVDRQRRPAAFGLGEIVDAVVRRRRRRRLGHAPTVG